MTKSMLRNAVLYRTYSRRIADKRESWSQICDRAMQGLVELGVYLGDEIVLMRGQIAQSISFPAGRWLWVGGTSWIKKPENFSGAYNCSSLAIENWSHVAETMNLAMTGCGTGVVILPDNVDRLSSIKNFLSVKVVGSPGDVPSHERKEKTEIFRNLATSEITITVGDSRQGWVNSFMYLLDTSTTDILDSEKTIQVTVDLSNVRPKGEVLKGFGGVANPDKLKDFYPRVTKILNKAVGRKLTPTEVCLVVDEGALVVVAGGIRRSAGIRQGHWSDAEFALAKHNLWQQNDAGQWAIDPDRSAMRMANHTRVLFDIPTEAQCIAAVRQQIASGEGAIQYAPEAIARANNDVLPSRKEKNEFIELYLESVPKAINYLVDRGAESDSVMHRLERFGLNPCGEIISKNFFCNLTEVHLNQLNPLDIEAQKVAFKAAGLFAVGLLHHKFPNPLFQDSREKDPIIGVSFTGLFDFFTNLFGTDWIRWWQAGRPEVWGEEFALHTFKERMNTHYFSSLNLSLDWSSLACGYREVESAYLSYWRKIVFLQVHQYCDRNDLKIPNRCTTVQPAGTKSLLTNASCGWHPPKFLRYIRRITFAPDDPVAQACLQLGYKITPGQGDTNSQGHLLEDPFAPGCTEWLVEIPLEVSWAHRFKGEDVDLEFSALAQIDFYFQVQKYYTTHNTSATFEVCPTEAEAVGKRLHEAIVNNEGYISAAILGRSKNNGSFPRLPYEPISRDRYYQEIADIKDRALTIEPFLDVLNKLDLGWGEIEGPMGCDSDKCLVSEGVTK